MLTFSLADLSTEVRVALDVLRRVQTHPDVPPKFGPILDSTIADTSRILREVLDTSSPPDDLQGTIQGDFDAIYPA
jgi:hypothetical protein